MRGAIVLSYDDKEWIRQQIHDHAPSGCLHWVIIAMLLFVIRLLGGC